MGKSIVEAAGELADRRRLSSLERLKQKWLGRTRSAWRFSWGSHKKHADKETNRQLAHAS